MESHLQRVGEHQWGRRHRARQRERRVLRAAVEGGGGGRRWRVAVEGGGGGLRVGAATRRQTRRAACIVGEGRRTWHGMWTPSATTLPRPRVSCSSWTACWAPKSMRGLTEDRLLSRCKGSVKSHMLVLMRVPVAREVIPNTARMGLHAANGGRNAANTAAR